MGNDKAILAVTSLANQISKTDLINPTYYKEETIWNLGKEPGANASKYEEIILGDPSHTIKDMGQIVPELTVNQAIEALEDKSSILWQAVSLSLEGDKPTVDFKVQRIKEELEKHRDNHNSGDVLIGDTELQKLADENIAYQKNVRLISEKLEKQVKDDGDFFQESMQRLQLAAIALIRDKDENGIDEFLNEFRKDYNILTI
ncbi:MAG: hypothetical protein KDD76_05530 [Rickettsiales bacterium]|nr:hypothetical protein [Rickettsiales bacterium]